MPKILVLGANLNNDQKARLEALGEVKYLPSPSNSDELVKQTQRADILYSNGAFLLESLSELKNVFVTYPYIELGAFDSQKLKKNNVLVANTQGSSRETVAEWALFMVLALFRKLIPLVRTTKQPQFQLNESLVGRPLKD